MGEIIEVKIEATNGATQVVEVDAAIVARIIMHKAHAREKPARVAANAILDYLAECMKDAVPVA